MQPTFLLTLAALAAGVPAMAVSKNTAVIDCKQLAIQGAGPGKPLRA